ncbi:MAG: asparagine synthetase B, partial [Bacteroidota bacterium]|nr:asparagine synthetase B [Bacteroidota bacterium]
MCGITGVLIFDKKADYLLNRIDNAIASLQKRGPDSNGVYRHNNVAIGNTRLSIIDTSTLATQPITDKSGRYTIVFNGEIFNYKELQKSLLDKGIELKSNSDTEVLLYLYITEGTAFLDKLNGFFAFAIYDKEEQSLFIARDRMGVKPLFIYQDEEKLIFGSEMKSLIAYGIPKEIDYVSLYNYFRLTYIPAPYSIFKNVRKVGAGTYLEIKGKEIKENRYYSIPESSVNESLSY